MSDVEEENIHDENTSDWLNNFNAIYQNLSKNNLSTLHNIYHQDIVFEDPLHKVEGLSDFVAYFEDLYTNVVTCTFEINHAINNSNEAAIYWEMKYQHPKLNAGKTISVIGHSHLKMKDNKVIYHRDYLDLGAMLYEHIPLVGVVVRFLKNRISK